LYAFANDIYSFVADPLMSLLPEGSQMIATEVASPFLAPFKLTLVVAVFIAIPFVLHQAWAFVAPGLYDNEKMLAIPILVSSVALFYAGAAFAYYVVFPLLFEFFTQTGPENVAVMTDINQYLNFVLKLFFAFGVAFEIPIATFLLILSGATTVESLSKKRPYIVLGCFVIGMLLTPPDVISQSLLAIPMYLLYEVGLLFGRLVRKRRAEADAEDQES
ncbi:MAG TPA: twin-arginine translocase subunit TatC, partial [Halomonas sp.]|nr:twin-arginine translocase subunit TatC [Halomonas sp.]